MPNPVHPIRVGNHRVNRTHVNPISAGMMPRLTGVLSHLSSRDSRDRPIRQAHRARRGISQPIMDTDQPRSYHTIRFPRRDPDRSGGVVR